MEALTSARRPAAAQNVAVVAADDLALRRICDAAAAAGIVVLDAGNQVDSLSGAVAGADAIVLAGATSANQCRLLIREVVQRYPGIPLVMVSSEASSSPHKALEAGASGIVHDTNMDRALAFTIGAVVAGQVVVPLGLRRHATRPALSHRERQTLALVAMGLTNSEIAARLYLAESTVKTHLTSIFGKLGVRSRNEATALALDPEQNLGLGLLGLSPDGSIAATAGEQRV